MNSYVKSAFYSEDIKKQSSHYHDCHQIIYIIEGEIQLDINGSIKTANTGDIIIISRFENHSIKILNDIYKRYVLRISANLPNDDEVFSVFTNRPQKFNNIISAKQNQRDIETILNRIVNEYSSGNSLTEKLQNLLINELLIYIRRLLPYELNEYNSNGFDLVRDLKNEFENFYYREFRLDALANKYNTSISTLTHTFKKIVGVSVYEYLLSCRMAIAKTYLSKSDLSIGEIVEKCGFTDNSNFSRSFKKINNLTPLEFRKKYK